MNDLLFQCNQPLQGCCTILGSWTVVFLHTLFSHADEMRATTNILELFDYKEPNCFCVKLLVFFFATEYSVKYLFLILPN